MINRIIIRSKILQVLFSAYQKEMEDLNLIESELLFSIQKTYDLYHYFLLLIPHLTDLQQKKTDLRKHKLLATAEELSPNTRFIDNRLAHQIHNNEQLQAFAGKKGLFWTDETAFTKKLLDQIIESDNYKQYLQSEDGYESDKEFWRQIFKTFIYNNDDLDDLLEEKSIYWNDDVEVVKTFVVKTIKRFEEPAGAQQQLLPMFKDEIDREFAVRLLRQAFLKREDLDLRIKKHTVNWDFERIANMDLYIMQMAIAELLAFPNIPVSVTLNEYIDLAKVFSTPKSALFINGILDAIVEELKAGQEIFKS
jgi:N utilization substance protein B